MELKKIDPLSFAKVQGVLGAMMGLLIGGLFSLVSIAGLAAASEGSGGSEAELGFLFGAGAIVIAPIFYGVAGAVGGAISALLYNVIARMIGGIRVELS